METIRSRIRIILAVKERLAELHLGLDSLSNKTHFSEIHKTMSHQDLEVVMQQQVLEQQAVLAALNKTNQDNLAIQEARQALASEASKILRTLDLALVILEVASLETTIKIKWALAHFLEIKALRPWVQLEFLSEEDSAIKEALEMQAQALVWAPHQAS